MVILSILFINASVFPGWRNEQFFITYTQIPTSERILPILYQRVRFCHDNDDDLHDLLLSPLL